MDQIIQFKACPKCHGDLHRVQDMYGSYLDCIQCGYLKYLDNTSR